MKKLGICILFSMLVAIPAIASVPKAKSVLYEELNEENGWETVYQRDSEPTKEVNAKTNSGITDLEVARIQRKYFWLLRAWRIIYWIENEEYFVGTFADDVYLENDERIHIDRIWHINEPMWVGINGPYRTVYFSVEPGWYRICVELDVFNDVPEYDESNNVKRTRYMYWW